MSYLSTDNAIELINVNKNFQDFIAVNNLNLQIRQGVGHHWIIGYGSVLEELKYFAGLIDIEFVELV